MNINKYGLEELTFSQKDKANKIITLLDELKKEGVYTCVASTPQNRIIFYRSKKIVKYMEEIQYIHNNTDFMYEGEQPEYLIDVVGY